MSATMRVPPPRILVVSGEQWPRALLRAQLDEAGYDAIGDIVATVRRLVPLARLSN